MPEDPVSPELQALQKSENEYRRLVEMSPDLVMLCDEHGVVLYVNFAGVEILGYELPDELMGRKLEEFVAPGRRADVGARLRALLGGIHAMPFVEEVFLRADGRPIHVDMMGRRFLRDGNCVVHLVIRDVTRRKQAEAAQRRLRRQRLGVAGLLLVAVLGAAGYHGYHYSESTRFCADQCHSVMQPEGALHRRSAHAHVTCAQCHIGAGASWYVKAKISGLHQVYAVLAETYSRPIPAPIVNLRPASETCEHCHSSRVFHGNKIRSYRTVPEDSNVRDPIVSVVVLRVGGYRPAAGTFTGIHWHTGPDNRVEFRSADARRASIHAIRFRLPDGTTRQFDPAAAAGSVAGSSWRVMDCSDCHNRVPHDYEAPEIVVDRLLLDGRLPASLPEIRKASLQALRQEYPSRSAAQAGILAGLQEFYRRGHPQPVAHGRELETAARTLYRDAYSPNVYPALRIGWNTYPNNLGHRDGLGCFRCHDGEHRTTAGRVLSQDCDLCHFILADGVRESELQPAVRQLLNSR